MSYSRCVYSIPFPRYYFPGGTGQDTIQAGTQVRRTPGSRCRIGAFSEKRIQRKESGPHPASTQRSELFSAAHVLCWSQRSPRAVCGQCGFHREGPLAGGRLASDPREVVGSGEVRGRRPLTVGRRIPSREAHGRGCREEVAYMVTSEKRPERWQKRCGGEPGWAGSYLSAPYT